jgi:Flp pilus assembly protein TadG
LAQNLSRFAKVLPQHATSHRAISNAKGQKYSMRKSPLAHAMRAANRFCRRFARQDDGGLIVFAMLLLTTMLVLGGMAVDFIRYESQRAQLQSVADRAALAAAAKSSDLDGAAVIRDFFITAGLEHTLVGDPTVRTIGNAKITTVTAQLDVDTFFLRMAGIDTLTSVATTSAREEVSNVEISLLLDVSGSMRFGGRFAIMQNAAVAFANSVLRPENAGLVSLNIIPYAGQVNVGAAMFDYLGAVRYSVGPDGIFGTADDDPFPQYSSCIELEATDWTTSGLPPAGRAQTAHFQAVDFVPSVMDWGWCPQDRTAIQYAVSDPAVAETFIRGMRMHAGTGTQYAMKYALALLDPTSQPAFAHLNAISPNLVPDDFADRPAAWDDPGTKKIIVLMTDGEILQQVRPISAVNPGNLTTIYGWFPWSWGIRYIAGPSTSAGLFSGVCDVAKDPSRNVAVYTVAFQTSSVAATQMRDCASDPSMFFPASGAGLTAVFEDVANRISDLRLTQ